VRFVVETSLLRIGVSSFVSAPAVPSPESLAFCFVFFFCLWGKVAEERRHVMYGLLLVSLAEHVKSTFGEDKWDLILRAAGLPQATFSTHSVYPESYLPRLVQRATEVLQLTEFEFMGDQGEFFVDFVGQYGYDRVLSVLGRHMRDFLNGLDNLHEYLKFSYPRMRAPSFFVENETATGLTLQYRSKRKGFNFYTMVIGLIRKAGKSFYNTDVDIEMVKEERVLDLNVVTLQLTFDNRAYVDSLTTERDDQTHLTLKSAVFLDIFPFCIVFNSNMVIKSIGNSLSHILPNAIGQKVSSVFNVTRPLIEFTFNTVGRGLVILFYFFTKPCISVRKKNLLLLGRKKERMNGGKDIS